MPNISLYNILTTNGSENSAYALDVTMQLLKKRLEEDGIPMTAANALAGVLGGNPSVRWRLYDAKKNPEISSTGSNYKWDGKERYFFQYMYDPLTDPTGYGVILEYSRSDPPFEIRGITFKDDTVSDAKVTDPRVREAIIGMLLSILWTEMTFPQFAACATEFERQYRSKFISGPQNGYLLARQAYDDLKECVTPKNRGNVEGFFEVSAACLNNKSMKLKRILEGESGIGYFKTENTTIYLAADAQTNVAWSKNIPEDAPSLIEIMQPILGTQKVQPVKKLEPFMYPVQKDRVYAEDEKPRLLEIPDWYVPVPKIVQYAKNIAESNVFERPLRNLLIRGPAGSGKTEGAKAIASMTGSPYGVVTGHAEMEFFDLTSMMVPRTESDLHSDGELLDYLLYAVRDKDLHLPDMGEMALFPGQVYQQITGNEKEDATEDECMAALAAKLIGVCKQDTSMFVGGNSSKFKVVRSDLAIGLERGWLIELQEMNTLLKAGTLVGLNNIMELGTLQLPTGETIRRHPDTVIVFTQNVGYAGTVDGNQSVYSRIELKCDLKAPSEDEMVRRIKMHVPQLPEMDIRTIVQTAALIRARCGPEIESGSVGTREEIAWAKMTYLCGNMLEAAEDTILPSCSEDEADISTVREAIMLSLNTEQ